MAMALLRQPAGRGRNSGRCCAVHACAQRAAQARDRRLGKRDALDRNRRHPPGHGLGGHPVRVVLLADRFSLRSRRDPARRLRLGRAPRARAGSATAPLQERHLHTLEHRERRRGDVDVRRHLLPAGLRPGRDWQQCHQLRGDPRPDAGLDDRHKHRWRLVHLPHRAVQGSASRWSRLDGRRLLHAGELHHRDHQPVRDRGDDPDRSRPGHHHADLHARGAELSEPRGHGRGDLGDAAFSVGRRCRWSGDPRHHPHPGHAERYGQVLAGLGPAPASVIG